MVEKGRKRKRGRESKKENEKPLFFVRPRIFVLGLSPMLCENASACTHCCGTAGGVATAAVLSLLKGRRGCKEKKEQRSRARLCVPLCLHVCESAHLCVCVCVFFFFVCVCACRTAAF